MDIEEIHFPAFKPRSQMIVNSRFRKSKQLSEIPVGDNISGVQRVFVRVWGCAHNTSDAEYMAGLLSSVGYNVTLGGGEPDLHMGDDNEGEVLNNECEGTTCNGGDDCCQKKSYTTVAAASVTQGNVSSKSASEAADLWILNSCTVKGPAEDHFRNAVLEAKAKGKKVVVAGCVPQGSPNLKYLKDVSVVGVQQIDRVVEVVEQTLLGNTVRFIEKRIDESDPRQRRLAGAPLSLPKIRRNSLIEILAISTGCLNACTYCKTKHARGVLASYPIAELVARAKEAFAEGVKEVWLTSEDLGAYGRDLPRSDYASVKTTAKIASRWPNHLTLADLLVNLVGVIPPGCMLRLGMTNPPYILDQLEEIASILCHPRVYAFIHIPVQSASNDVLNSMRRQYTVEEFEQVVNFLTENVPLIYSGDKLTVATDIICGFPTETEPYFQETVGLIERYKFPVLYINQFFARPGTPAASMKREATTAEVKRRTRTLHDLFRTYRPFTGREGRLYRVLITEASSDGLFWVGHTKAYEQILLPKEANLRGRIVLAEVTECDKFFMRGRILDRGPFDSLVDKICFELTDNISYQTDLVRSARVSQSTFLNDASIFNFRFKHVILPMVVIAFVIGWIMVDL